MSCSQISAHRSSPSSVDDRSQLDAFLAQPQKHLADAAELAELAEDELDGLADPSVRIHLDAIVRRPHVSDGDGHQQLSATSLLHQRLDG